MDTYEVVVLGGGSAGEAIAGDLADAGRRVALIEEKNVGGECPYVACMPSTAMLRSASVRTLARRLTSAGAASGNPQLDSDRDDQAAAIRRRDDIVDHRDDAGSAASLQERGVVLLRGRGRIVARGAVAVGDRTLGYDELVIATVRLSSG